MSYTAHTQWEAFKTDMNSNAIFNKWYEYIKLKSHYNHPKHAFNSLCKHDGGFTVSSKIYEDKIYYKFRSNKSRSNTYLFNQDYQLITIYTRTMKIIYKTQKINKKILQ